MHTSRHVASEAAMDSTKDKLGECPICFCLFNLAILQDHTNDCIDNSQVSIKGLPSPSGSASSGDFFSPPRKRPHIDLSGWITTNKPKALNTLFSSNASQQVDLLNDKARVDEIIPSDSGTNSKGRQIPSFPLRDLDSNLQQPGASNGPAKNGISKRVTIAPTINDHVPLAERMRPKSLTEFVGQEKIMGDSSILRSLIAENDIPSMILWGPPGCGKTSLANIIAVQCRQKGDSKFVKLSATSSGVNEVKEAIKIAKTDMALWKRKTILFIDEIHRFNKLQQDTFLPYVENGTIILIGATTENPSFSLNSALLSRCRVFVLEKLSSENIKNILHKAMEQLNVHRIEAGQTNPKPLMCMEIDALDFLANMSDGDARTALNGLHLAVQADKCSSDVKTVSTITVKQIKESLQRSHLLYDRKGEEHYNCISALHKSMRGNDGNASLYWLGRMLEGGEDPLYVARRLVRFASEDIGLADPGALTQAVAAYQACQCIGMPECDVILAQCVVYLAEAQKSVRVYNAYNKVKKCIHDHAGPLPGVPLHLRNAPTKLMKDLGYSKGYKYNPNYEGPVQQDYMPEGLKHKRFLDAD